MNKKWKWLKAEAGQVLVLVLVLMAVGALILGPLLSYMSTGLKSGTVYENKATDYYAADSGIEDGLWQIKNDHLQTLIPNYDPYGFDVMSLSYPYPSPINVNNENVAVTVSNVWIPKQYGVAAPLTPSSMLLDTTDLNNIVEDARLVTAGSSSGITSYKITLSYNYDVSDPVLKVSQVGVWLPPGFTYTPHSCDLWVNPSHPSEIPSSEEIVAWDGGTSIIWKFNTPVLFSHLSGYDTGGNGVNQKVVQNFQFTPQTTGDIPNAISWIYPVDNNGVNTNLPKDIRFSWAADFRVFKIISVSAGGTTVEAYGIKAELRNLANTINGDYQAIGNSLMTDSDHDGYYRETLLTESTTTESAIPSDADVAAAYLYWSGWKIGNAAAPTATSVSPLNPDAASNFNNWTQTVNSAWSLASGNNYFQGHYTSGGEAAKYITLTALINLSSYAGKTVTISWQQWVGGAPDAGDQLYLSISNDGGTTWSDGNVGSNGTMTLQGNTAAASQPALANYSYTIPGSYLTANFKMRLYLQSFSLAGRNCYVDNISIQQQYLNDTCDAGTWPNWTNGGDWSTANSGPTPLAFMGHDSTSSANTSSLRYITLTNSKSASVGQTVMLTMQQWAAGSGLSSSDRLYVSFSSDGGSSWSTETEIARGSGGTNFGTAATPVSYTTTYAVASPGNLKIRFRVYGFTTSGRNVYVDNVVITGPAIAPLNPDTCSNFNNWSIISGAWTLNSASGNPSPSFQGQYTGADDSARNLTLGSSINLSAYSSQTVTVSWDQWASGTLNSADALQVEFSGDGGATWSSPYTAAQNQGQNGGFYISASSPYPPPSPAVIFGIRVPSQYLTGNFKMQFYLAGFGSGKYCYIDNIYLQYWPTSVLTYDPASSLSGWTTDSDWLNYYNSEFAGHHASGTGYLTMSSSLNLSAHIGQMVAVAWEQRYTGSLTSSALQYEFWDGSSWSIPKDALDSASHPGSFSVNIPSQYVTANFKVRLYLTSTASFYVNNIKIYTTGQLAATTAYLKINGHQVSFDANGQPQKDVTGVLGNLQADRAYVTPNYISGTPSGSSFAGFKDVTALIRSYGTKGPNNNSPGNDTYTVGGVNATPAANHTDNQYQLAYAGWSLVIIYTSPQTLGHQLYIYDNSFLHNDGNSNLDFDQDGHPGGTITGFLVPQPIEGEVNAAQLTCFVGEGDDLYTGDYIALNDTKLWDGINTTGNSQASPNNVWNGKSLGMSADGVDVDTFHISWASNILHSGDNSAQIDMVTTTDEWSLVYIIISFRSQTTTGGAITYLIKST